MAKINVPLEAVRDELHNQGKNLKPSEWKELLEELQADIVGHLDAIKEEGGG
jgi:hypothetical protein